jgi:hypothetical protein
MCHIRYGIGGEYGMTPIEISMSHLALTCDGVLPLLLICGIIGLPLLITHWVGDADV